MINRFVIAILLITTLIVATPSAAFANPPDIDTPSTATYRSESAPINNGIRGFIDRIFSFTENIIYGPPRGAVCMQHTDNVHRSSRNPERVNVHVDARCPVIVAEMYHKATLLKSNDPQYGYREVPNLTERRGTFHRFGVRRGRAVANYYCTRDWFEGTGKGYIIYNGLDTKATARTSSPRPEFNPCGLP